MKKRRLLPSQTVSPGGKCQACRLHGPLAPTQRERFAATYEGRSLGRHFRFPTEDTLIFRLTVLGAEQNIIRERWRVRDWRPRRRRGGRQTPAACSSEGQLRLTHSTATACCCAGLPMRWCDPTRIHKLRLRHQPRTRRPQKPSNATDYTLIDLKYDGIDVMADCR